jgi:hypothetical protein
LIARAREYVEKTRCTYRQSVRHNRCLIGYPLDEQEGSAASCSAASSANHDQSVVDHKLIWRFLTWLGGLTFALDEARTMILRRNPQSTCHRLDGNIDPHKALHSERLTTLETARQLLQVIPEWEASFGCRFFPRFATRAGFD